MNRVINQPMNHQSFSQLINQLNFILSFTVRKAYSLIRRTPSLIITLPFWQIFLKFQVFKELKDAKEKLSRLKEKAKKQVIVC